MEGKNIVFPGRFQPLTLAHLEIAQEIGQTCERLVLATPDNQFRTRQNPFLGTEVVEMGKMAEIEMQQVPIDRNLLAVWKKYLEKNKIDLVVTGNWQMALIVLACGGKVKCFKDGGNNSIRASEVRKKMITGDNSWKELLDAGVAKYIETLQINFNELPEGRKRWYR